ncbi:hypothetical protein HX89_00690 [Dermacoccus nishinomiyaensis]|uniref:Uncharacterized protein n=1 Tax=Dermacoccus nishinomiyaensis TaxID=1274 RepID=A0A075JEY3_9MICO|nr:hypothetical protein HX89_00690 [Dermacoccus nishinomiyaensis]
MQSASSETPQHVRVTPSTLREEPEGGRPSQRPMSALEAPVDDPRHVEASFPRARGPLERFVAMF